MRWGRWMGGAALPMSALAALAALAVISAAIFAGCNSTEAKPSCKCDTEFRTFTLAVSDAAGPVDSAQVRVFRVSDGSDITGYAYDPPGPGYVTAFTDDILYDLPAGTARMDVRVAVSKGTEKGEAIMSIAADECRCHISKLSGPDNVVLK